MIRFFRTDQEMEVHKARSRRHIEPELDIREDKPNIRKAPGSTLPKYIFVRVGNVIVCNTNSFNLGRGSFQRGQITCPSVTASELVVQNGSGRMDVRFPAPPLRSSVDSQECTLCALASGHN